MDLIYGKINTECAKDLPAPKNLLKIGKISKKVLTNEEKCGII
jgi:hypothetical protein